MVIPFHVEHAVDGIGCHPRPAALVDMDAGPRGTRPVAVVQEGERKALCDSGARHGWLRGADGDKGPLAPGSVRHHHKMVDVEALEQQIQENDPDGEAGAESMQETST